jgi:hypothetical protein
MIKSSTGTKLLTPFGSTSDRNDDAKHDDDTIDDDKDSGGKDDSDKDVAYD